MSLNDTSRRLWNRDFFGALAPEVLLVNGARGGHVDEEALREFLAARPGSFAFLDVFEREPFGDEWLGVPQVWKTSHIAGVEKELDNKILEFETAVLRDFLALAPGAFGQKYRRALLQNKWIKGVLI
jgi:D-3-phosphoglycerate dehydrogenase